MTSSISYIILGCGGHAAVVADALLALGHPVLGCVDRPNADAAAPDVLGLPFLGDETQIERHSPDKVLLALGVGGGSRTIIRRDIFLRWKAKGYRFGSFVHPAAVVGRDVVLGEGVQVMAGAIIQPRCLLGDNVLVNTGARIDHDCRIAAHAHVAPGAVLCGVVTVGEAALIGAGAVILPQGCVDAGQLVPARSSDPR